MKSFLRRQAFIFKKRINNSQEAYDLCNDQDKGIRKSHHEGLQNRHTIMSRQFEYVPLREVDHLTRPPVASVSGCKAMFCFFGKTGCAGELCVSERSCYECASCFDFNGKSGKCRNIKYTGPIHEDTEVKLEQAAARDPELTARQNELQQNLKRKIKRNKNIVVRLKSGSWAMGKAAGPPFSLKKDTGKGEEWITKGTAKHPVWVVEMFQYEADSASKAKDQFDCTYVLGIETCDKYLCDCGTQPPKGKQKGWAPCFKRHRSIYRLRDVREPVGFELDTPRKSHRSARSADEGDGRLRYRVSDLVKQQIQQNLNAVAFVETTKRKRGI